MSSMPSEAFTNSHLTEEEVSNLEVEEEASGEDLLKNLDYLCGDLENFKRRQTKSVIKPISLRLDVMHKNLFRAIKKQLKVWFAREGCQTKNFESCIEEFGESILKSSRVQFCAQF